MPHNNLYIVDNDTEEQSVKHYLQEWCQISKQMDIATGYFEIGGLLVIDSYWQKLDKIRIILGSEVTKRTKEIIDLAIKALISRLDQSIESEKEHNEFLTGIPSVLEALRNGKIECRVFDEAKFHAKTYITYFKDEYHQQFSQALNIPVGYALVGSSNFTKAGLTQNIELNVQISSNVEQLQAWYELHWNQATDITSAILSVIESHCRDYSPYEVYMKSMFEHFKGKERTVSDWEMNESSIYKILSQYQRDGYNSMVKIADKYLGAFLCDGVGLGKTFIGMMLIERFVKKERKNVVLIVPAAARISVWEVNIKKYIPEILEGFYSFKIINQTDILLEKNENLMDKISEQAECIIIDEAHHFRNRSSGRYRKLFEIIGNGCMKRMYMLTATPINNSFLDLQHLIELFTQREENYFKGPPLGIHSLSGHFRKMESRLNILSDNENMSVADDSIEADSVFKGDKIVNELIVQRSRVYVKKSLGTEEGTNVLFPFRQPPKVAEYSLRKSYGRLIDDFVSSFYRKDAETGREIPILALAIYSPYSSVYYIGDRTKIDSMKLGRQTQVVNLIRQLLLKRFESSTAAFEETCIRIYVRLRRFVEDSKAFGNVREIERFFVRNEPIFSYCVKYLESYTTYTFDDLEDDLPDYIWDVDDNLKIEDFDISVMVQDTVGDLEILSDFISDFMVLDSGNDDKMKKLIDILKNNPKLMNKKVIIFTEYRSTAIYIFRVLKQAGITGLYELDGQSKVNRKEIIERFSPYYNDKTSGTIEDEINVLVATDVLAEGLNLQDATCLINYELHWNPVRLMQRIGRVDRRRSLSIENQILSDHPELTADRENVYFWNFLPPIELEQLLSLYSTVSQKTLRISRTFGIEGKQLLTPEDDFDALKDFNSAYEGTESHEEVIALAYQELVANNIEFTKLMQSYPAKISSGKTSISLKGIFFCYNLPTKCEDGTWSNEHGINKWYILDSNSREINESTYEIWLAIKSCPDDIRNQNITEENFLKNRKIVESYINKTYMRSVQAPMGIHPELVTWMQLN